MGHPITRKWQESEAGIFDKLLAGSITGKEYDAAADQAGRRPDEELGRDRVGQGAESNQSRQAACFPAPSSRIGSGGPVVDSS